MRGRAAAHHRPADGVGVHPEDEPERRRQRPVETRPSSGPRDRRTAPALPRPGSATERDRSPNAAAGSPKRASASGWRGDVDDRSEQLPAELGLVPRERSEQPAPGRSVVRPSIRVEAGRGRRERPLEHDRPPVVERVGDAGHPAGRTRRRAQPSRPSGRTVTRAASGTIDEHTSWRNPGSVSSSVRVPPPIVGRRLVDPHRAAGAGECQRRRQPVRAGPDDDGVERRAGRRSRRLDRLRPPTWNGRPGV